MTRGEGRDEKHLVCFIGVSSNTEIQTKDIGGPLIDNGALFANLHGKL